MTNSIFIDTGAWKAIYDKDDPFHQLANRTLTDLRKKRSHLFTSNFVVDETLTLLRIRVSHAHAVEFGETLRASKITSIVQVEIAMENEAWTIFKKYSDKDFSFTDCTSFAIMKKLAIESAFALDDHFRQFGFICNPHPADVRKVLRKRTGFKK